jgi:hypothetical protein
MNWDDFYPPSQIDEEEQAEEFNNELLAADDKIKSEKENCQMTKRSIPFESDR